MDDKDVRRLEDRVEASSRESQLRIESVNRESQLRLDNVLARIDGKFDLITLALSEVRSGQAGLKADLSETRNVGRSWGMWAVGATVGGVITLLVAIPASLFALKQIWIGGVQVGQTLSTSLAPSYTPAQKP